MFEREHHRRVATVLEALDAETLTRCECWFGGGTAIVLKHGEYRDSLDLDFLISKLAGYRELRSLCGDNIAALVRPTGTLRQLRDVRADQYGIRTLLDVDGAAVKLEIVLEGRIAFGPPSSEPIRGIATLSTLDMAASKLLANSDRWADDSVHSRDLIDLAMLELDKPTMKLAIEKASTAYASVERELASAIAALAKRRGRLDACMRALQMLDVPPGVAPVPPALLWHRIKQLAPKR